MLQSPPNRVVDLLVTSGAARASLQDNPCVPLEVIIALQGHGCGSQIIIIYLIFFNLLLFFCAREHKACRLQIK